MPGLYRNAEEKRQLEARNGAIQFLAVLNYIDEWRPESVLTPQILQELQRLAVNQIYSCAGRFRDGPVAIQDVIHQPPDHREVPRLVEELCTYVNDSWHKNSAIHLSSYVMWRLNWIHPFFGGNGRTSRSLSYLVLCARLGFRLPGSPTIPDSIVAQREPYYRALRAADAAWAAGSIDLGEMESLLGSLLATQLLSIHKRAAEGDP